MKYCVQANLIQETPASRDTLNKDIQSRIGGKKLWGDAVNSNSQDMDGSPNNTIVIRFDNEADMDDLFDFISKKMVKIPVLKGSVSKHVCYHDEQPSKLCEILDSFVK